MSYFAFWFDYLENLHLIYRAGFSFIVACILVLVLCKFFIPLMQKKFTQPIREEGPDTHMSKIGTPTLGGVVLFLGFFISCFIWISSWNNIVLSILSVILGFCFLGFIDDILKLTSNSSKGLSGKLRLIIGFVISFLGSYVIIQDMPSPISYSIFFPYFYNFFISIGITYLFFTSFVVVACANSVNLSDGLDGLASLLTFTIFSTFLILLTIIIIPFNPFQISLSFTKYFHEIPEIAIILASIMGALLGFLWYNSYPAKIFMGDVGSLGLGGALGIISVALKQELFLLVSSIFIIIEALSVILQVYSFKLRKKRIFLMAPIHHHFEKKGIPENNVVMRIWIFTVIMCIISLLMFTPTN